MSEALGPKKDKGTQEERLKKLLRTKEFRAEDAEHQLDMNREFLESARTGATKDLFSSHDPEGPIRESFDAALGDMIRISDQMRGSSQPAEEARRLIDIVAQRGAEWAEGEGSNDSRMVLLSVALSSMEPKQFGHSGSLTKVFQRLIEGRNDHNFLSLLASTIVHKRMEFGRYRIDNKRSAGEYREAKKESANSLEAITESFVRNIKREEKRLGTARRHVAKVKSILERMEDAKE